MDQSQMANSFDLLARGEMSLILSDLKRKIERCKGVHSIARDTLEPGQYLSPPLPTVALGLSKAHISAPSIPHHLIASYHPFLATPLTNIKMKTSPSFFPSPFSLYNIFNIIISYALLPLNPQMPRWNPQIS